MKRFFFIFALSFSQVILANNYDPIDGIDIGLCQNLGNSLPSVNFGGFEHPMTMSFSSNKEDTGSIGDYRTDSCPLNNSVQERVYKIGYCRDNTISFEQPDSEGMFDSEGKCGQVLVSNMLRMYCRLNLTPTQANYYVDDITPGVSPGTLVSGMNKLFDRHSNCPSGDWEISKPETERDFIIEVTNALSLNFSDNQVRRKRDNGYYVKRAPVGPLIRTPGPDGDLHWITVVDVVESDNECSMVFNTWDDQYIAPCSEVAKWSRGVEKSYPFLDEYTIVNFDY